MFFSIKSKAISQQELHDWLSSENIVLGSSYETTFYNTAVQYYGAEGFGVCYIIGYADGTYSMAMACYDKSYYPNMIFSYPNWLYNNNSTFNARGFQYRVTFSNNIYTVSTQSSTFNNQGCYLTSYWTTNKKHGNTNFVPPIDWNNAYYSSNIPAPMFEVYNAELNVVPTVDVPLSFDFQFVPSNTYVEVWADYTIPTKLNVLPQPNNGAQFRVLDYVVNSVNVIDKEELFESEALTSNYLHVALRNDWSNVLTNYPANQK